MVIDANGMHFKVLNEKIRDCNEDVIVNNCCGQRYIASGMNGKKITINGVPGNALAAYMGKSTIVVNGNAQDALGDTMNAGKIIVNGNAGDACGYAMRGGKIFIRGNAGYRCGIHMKAYQEHKPTIVVGGKVGSFLGEYQAGGTIIVLGLGCEKGSLPVGNFCSTGMHGGAVYMCTDSVPSDLAPSIMVNERTDEDLAEIKPVLEEYCADFGLDISDILKKKMYVFKPDVKNLYKAMYARNTI